MSVCGLLYPASEAKIMSMKDPRFAQDDSQFFTTFRMTGGFSQALNMTIWAYLALTHINRPKRKNDTPSHPPGG